MPGGKQSGVRKVNAVTWRLGIGPNGEVNVRFRKPEAGSARYLPKEHTLSAAVLGNKREERRPIVPSEAY